MASRRWNMTETQQGDQLKGYFPEWYKSIKHLTHENIKGSYLAYRPLGRAKGYLRGQFQVSLKINLSEM